MSDDNVRRELPKIVSSFANCLDGAVVVGVNASFCHSMSRFTYPPLPMDEKSKSGTSESLRACRTNRQLESRAAPELLRPP